jgi:hypothetical protein
LNIGTSFIPTPTGDTAPALTFRVLNNGNATLTGNATISSPMSVTSGGSYSVAAGGFQDVTVVFTPSAGGTFTQNLAFTGGGGASLSLTGIGIPRMAGLQFNAPLGVLTLPMAVTGSYIAQPTLTDITQSGIARYEVNIPSDGSYYVALTVDAADTGKNSVYLNWDTMPTDPLMIVDMNPTTGQQARAVSWRGNGTDVSPQFPNKTFDLTAGWHQLIIAGREADTRIYSIKVFQAAPPPVPPSTPVPTFPADTATGVAVNPTLTWTGDATSYIVSLGTANPPPQVTTVATTSYTPASNLLNGTTYFWKLTGQKLH